MTIEEEMPKLVTGWILKRKTANSRTKLLGDSNKRFFTLDFENQNFFYAHSESSKTVSLPIPFAEIVSVEAIPNGETKEVPEQVPAKSGRFSMPKFPKMASRNAKGNHGIVVYGKEKKMELLFNSEAEVSKWLVALQQAQRMGMAKKNGESDSELKSTVAGSSGSSGSGASTPHNGSSPRDCIPEVIGRADEFRESANSRRPSSGLENIVLDADAADPVPPPPPPVESELTMQRTDTHDSGGNGGYRQSQKVRGKNRSKGTKNSPPDTSAWGQAHKSPQVARYADQGEGLSLKERLERLNFSDDEDSDREEHSEARHTGPYRADIGGAREVATKAKAPEKTTVESCEAEPFEAWDSEDES